MTLRRRLAVTLALSGALLLAVAGAALLVGAVHVPPATVLALLAGGAGEGVDRDVILSLRLPRIAVAALAGGALAVAGAAFQGLTRNPLAEPSVLGVSGGAAFGVVLGQLFGLGSGVAESLGLASFGFAGAFVAGGIVYLIAQGTAGMPVHALLLAGVVVGIFFGSAITVLISVVDVNRLGGVIHWLLGNIAPASAGTLAVFAGLAGLGVGLTVADARRLNLLALGDETAALLGVDALALKRRLFVAAALLVAAVVAFAGPIAFVGLIVPHCLRALVGPDHRVLVPAALLGGATFLLAADTLARTVVAPAEVAVGVITSLCGAPFFVYLLRARPSGVRP
jgi:iron complex transport system permease protein